LCFIRRSCNRPIPGRPAALLVLSAVAQILKNFTYHRTFVAGPRDAALEFAANIGKWQPKDVDLNKFSDADEMIELEVMVRAIKALQALGEEMGNPDRPAAEPAEAAAGRHPALILSLLAAPHAGRALARAKALWQGSARLVGAFRADSLDPGHAAVAQW
jgi:hypothetical protein